MATADSLPTDLTLDIGEDLAPDEFMTAIGDFLGYVDEITNAQQGNGPNVTWTVRVKEGSALIGVIPNSNAPSSIITTIYDQVSDGLTTLTKGNIKDSNLSDKAVKHLKSLSNLAARHGDTGSINIWVNRKSITVTRKISDTIRNSPQQDYHDIGSIEGRLEAIQDEKGTLKIRVKDVLYPRAINCAVPEHMMEKIFNAFRRHVEIEGDIHYRPDGTPMNIKVSAIDILPEDNELPSPADVRGIMASK